MITSQNFFNSLQEQYNNQLPFVAYRKPDSLYVKALLQTDDTLYEIESYNESGFVFAPFDDIEKAVLIPLEKAEEIQMAYTISRKVSINHQEYSLNQVEKQQYISLIKKGVEAIQNEQFQKVVLSRQETVKFSDSDPILVIKKLLNIYTTAFVFCWYHPKVGLWLGATPETLTNIEGNRFSAMALAGTQNFKGTLDVIWGDKEKQEQQIVTDFIVENLKPSVDNLKISDVETVKAGNLLHLKTMISANLKPEFLSLKQLISVLHPTPAVCGFPKGMAKKFILENEMYKREFYTGYLGELNFKSKITPRSSKRNIENRAYSVTKKITQLYVNLRCMQIKNNTALVYVGGGITKISNPEKEWQETVSKSLVIKSIL